MPKCAIKMKGEVNWIRPADNKFTPRRRSYSPTSVHPCLASLSVRLFSRCVRSSSGPSFFCRSWSTGCLPSRLPDTPGRWGGSTHYYNRNNRKTPNVVISVERLGVPPRSTWLQLQFMEINKLHHFFLQTFLSDANKVQNNRSNKNSFIKCQCLKIDDP